jgi:TonB family protein
MTPYLLALALAAPAAQPTPAAPTVPLHRLISQDDYPAAAVKAGEQGNVRVALDIAPEGRVTGCTIAASSRSAILDATTCRILRSRARFTPARNAAGKPVAGRFETTIAWRMENVAEAVPPAVQAAMSAWVGCIRPTLAKGAADLSRPARAVAEQAFPACRPQEDRLLGALSQATGSAATVEQERTALREQVVAMTEAARKAQQP